MSKSTFETKNATGRRKPSPDCPACGVNVHFEGNHKEGCYIGKIFNDAVKLAMDRHENELLYGSSELIPKGFLPDEEKG